MRIWLHCTTYLMNTTYWKYWKPLFDPDGRQRWQFCPPEPFDHFTEEDWQGPRGRVFLKEMAASFVRSKTSNVNSSDKVYRWHAAAQHPNGQRHQPSQQTGLNGALRKAIEFYARLQTSGGYWPGDYGGPMFLLPGLIIASYITESPLPAPHRALIARYFLNHQNADGGWGMHLEGPSTMFGTVLQYVALRILGHAPDEPELVQARAWIHAHGGATGVPSWGKFYLSVLGVYEWEGCNSLFPEMWLLPESLPFHPSRFWCHARMVYLPMSYCYGHRVTGRTTRLTEALRTEIYTRPYAEIDWIQARNACASTDLYFPQSGVLKFLNRLLNVYEKIKISAFRSRALNFILSYICAEDDHTGYINIGPVNQVINSIVVWHAFGKDSEAFKKHYERWFDYLWLAEDGMKMQGYNGSQLWDTAFATQAIMESGLASDFYPLIEKAYHYLDVAQIKEEIREHKKFYRHDSVGGWPFSTSEHGWPISDCTAEGLKTVLLIHTHDLVDKKNISDNRLQQAVNLILSMQNKDGGWATYECTRGPAWLELLNPSEVFGNIMIDYSYTECSSACVQALLLFNRHYPDYKSSQISDAVRRGIGFILRQQRPDGSWYGSWAVCFTYGTWFATEALRAYLRAMQEGFMPVDNALRKQMLDALYRAGMFLLSKQKSDGGWGESYQSCVKKLYTETDHSQIIHTAWAVMSLLNCDFPEARAGAQKGMTLLLQRQQTDGDWPQENISGVFNHNCMITYTSYRNVFPLWALSRCKHVLESQHYLNPNEKQSVFGSV
ncbi:MAG: squalene-hopene cyclase [Chitinophagales bacterium]|nr:MAG: squalene-hopene cyclase [Chitinophagales bacterium]